MLDFLSEKTRTPLLHGSILIACSSFLVFLFWNIFSVAPVSFFHSSFSYFWFFLALFFGLLSQTSSSAFPYLFTFLPSTRERDRFVPMRAVTYAFTVLILALGVGMSTSYLGFPIFTALTIFPSREVVFASLCIVSLLVAYGMGLYWTGLMSHSPSSSQALRIPFVYRYHKVLSDIVYAGFSFILDIVPFLWLPLLDILLRGDMLYGLYVLLAFAIGRILPVIVVSIYTGFHIDLSAWLLQKRQSVQYTIAGTYIIVSVFLFSFSTQMITQILPYFRDRAQLVFVFTDTMLPILLILPLWIYFFVRFRKVYSSLSAQLADIRTHLNALLRIRGRLSIHCALLPHSPQRCLSSIQNYIQDLDHEAAVLSSAVRHQLHTPLRARNVQEREERRLWVLLLHTTVCSVATIVLYYVFL